MIVVVPGTRVRLTRDVERFPDFIARAGMTGTISYVGQGNVWVRLDEPLKGAQEWDNAVQFSMEHMDVLSECMEVIS